MSNVAIGVEGLGKRYRLGATTQPYKTMRESLTSLATMPVRAASRLGRRSPGVGKRGHRPEFWALKDVSFEVKHGEVLGIIGRNGAGKSTLLKLLSQITEPTEGRIGINGRVASLLEVGTGFHPELTGRENVMLNGAILGMSRQEIARRFDEIVAFAEVEKFIDTQVKFYSSGMYLRLAFAVAAHLEPEILIVDEVLAVGDAKFQRKCLGKMQDVSGEGRTVLFVSHQMAAVENLCSRVIVLSRGSAAFDGSTNAGISKYLESANGLFGQQDLRERTDRSGSGYIRLTKYWLENRDREFVSIVQCGQDIYVALSYESRGVARNVDVGISFHDFNDRVLTVLYAGYLDQEFDSVSGNGIFRCRLRHLPLVAGRYKVGARVVVNGVEADWPRDGIGFMDVEIGDFYGTGRVGFDGSSAVMLDGDWSVQQSTGVEVVI